MGAWGYSLVSVALVGAVPLLGLAGLLGAERRVQRSVPFLVSFAVGALLGGAVLHLLPEAVARLGMGPQLSFSFLAGFVAFFVLERFLWLHSHESRDQEARRPRPVATLNLVGDGVHNLVDGMVIAASYQASPSVGVAATIAVFLHEVPQEIGDFGVLVHGGLPVRKAVAWNFLSGLTALVGVVLALTLGRWMEGLASLLLPFAAGSFLYIAGSDLIPELQHEHRLATSLWQILLIAGGIAVMALAGRLES